MADQPVETKNETESASAADSNASARYRYTEDDEPSYHVDAIDRTARFLKLSATTEDSDVELGIDPSAVAAYEAQVVELEDGQEWLVDLLVRDAWLHLTFSDERLFQGCMHELSSPAQTAAVSGVGGIFG